MSITYNGTLPSWITIDVANSRLVGAANTFYQDSQALANNAAQTALNQFATDAIASGDLNCGEEPAVCDGSDVERYEINPYTDGDVENSTGGVPSGQPVFNGEFPFKDPDDSCRWFSNEDFDGLQIDGAVACVVEIDFDPGSIEWDLRFWASFGFLWVGSKTAGPTPAGIYTRSGGSSAGPATLTVVQTVGGTTPGVFPTGCQPV